MELANLSREMEARLAGFQLLEQSTNELAIAPAHHTPDVHAVWSCPPPDKKATKFTLLIA